MEFKEMKSAEKFVDWLLDMEYLEKEDVDLDGANMADDMHKVKEVAPRFYNLLMCICDCEDRA